MLQLLFFIVSLLVTLKNDDYMILPLVHLSRPLHKPNHKMFNAPFFLPALLIISPFLFPISFYFSFLDLFFLSLYSSSSYLGLHLGERKHYF